MSLIAKSIPFVPCFMQVTKASPPYAGPLPPTPWGPPMGSAEFNHNNPQPISIEIHVWSWFDNIVRVKDGTSGMQVSSLTISGGLGATINQPPPPGTTPFDTKVGISQPNLQSAYKMFGPNTIEAMYPLFVTAWHKGTPLCSDWLAIFIK